MHDSINLLRVHPEVLLGWLLSGSNRVQEMHLGRAQVTPQAVKERLKEAYPGSQIEVVDLTGTHNHYQVTVTSPAFSELTRIQRHQSVMAVFDEELKTGEVHALTIRTEVPEE